MFIIFVKVDEIINFVILYVVKLCGIKIIVESGGVGVIVVMVYGIELVFKVNKIFGLGNSFVIMVK